METSETLRKLKAPGTQVGADALTRPSNYVFFGDITQVMIRAYKDSNTGLIRDLYEAVVFQQVNSAPGTKQNKSNAREFTLENLDWLSQCADEFDIASIGDVGNMPFVLNCIRDPQPEATGPINQFYRQSMNYQPAASSPSRTT